MKDKSAKIKDFIYRELPEHSHDIAKLLALEFGFSRQNAHLYIDKEIKDGKIIKVGKTNSARYFVVGGAKIEFSHKIDAGLAEDQIWLKFVKPMILNSADNIKSIIAYGFTEIYNNAIDHSEGTIIDTKIEIDGVNIKISIMDNGIGIFNKIQKALSLNSNKEAILHLSKGKFTTDPAKHSGQGIFFTSRIFDNFSIFSGGLLYNFQKNDWLLSKEKAEGFGNGTLIEMVLAKNSPTVAKDVFDKYADIEIGFNKTIVAVALSSDPGDPHVSRSQAKRLMMGLDKFKTVFLDFKGVDSVGQAFVDEIFRVFKNEHPDINIKYVNATADVEHMIKRGLA